MWAQISLSAPGRYFMGLSRNMEASEPGYGRSRAGIWSLVGVHMDGHGRLRGRKIPRPGGSKESSRTARIVAMRLRMENVDVL